jgi:hypothetical protein
MELQAFTPESRLGFRSGKDSDPDIPLRRQPGGQLQDPHVGAAEPA